MEDPVARPRRGSFHDVHGTAIKDTEPLARPQSPPPAYTPRPEPETSYGVFKSQLAPDVITPDSFRIPFSLRGIRVGSDFVPRDDITGFLEQYLIPSSDDQGTAPSRRVVVLHGTGGIGKSRLAAEFASNHSADDSFTSIFFFNADSIKKSAREALLRVWDQWPRGRHRPDVKPTNDDEILGALDKWFSIPENNRWLIIFDNCDAPQTKEFNIEDYFPHANHGSILITSRLKSLGQRWKGMEVPLMSVSQATRLLGETITTASSRSIATPSVSKDGAGQITDQDLGSSSVLATELGRLPLALVQAGSFIGSCNTTIETFRKQLDESRDTVLADLDSAWGDQDERANIRTTWKLTFNQLSTSVGPNSHVHRRAAKFLLLLGFLDPHDIWFDLLRTGVLCPDAPSWFLDTFRSLSSFLSTIRVLADLHLVRGNDEAENFSMHGLIHQCCQGFLAEEERPEFLRLAITAVGYAAAQLEGEGWWKSAQKILPHADRIFELHNRVPPVDYFGVHGVDTRFMSQDRYGMVQQMLRGSTSIHDVTISHPLLALAYLYRELENFDKSRILLELCVQHFPSDDGQQNPWAFMAMRNLAFVLYKLDEEDKGRGVRLAEDAVKGFLEIFGPDHPLTLWSQDTLSTVLFDAGKSEESIRLEEHTMAVSEAKYGEISVWQGLLNLALSYRSVGDLEKSGVVARRGYDILTRRQGELASKIAWAARILATNALMEDNWDDYALYERRCLEEYRKVYGDAGEKVISEANEFASQAEEKEKWDLAEQIRREMVASARAAFGEADERTIRAQVRLCRCLRLQEKFSEVEELLATGLDMATKVLGTPHPVVGDYALEGGENSFEKKDWSQAEKWFVFALTNYEKTESKKWLRWMWYRLCRAREEGQGWRESEEFVRKIVDSWRDEQASAEAENPVAEDTVCFALSNLGRIVGARRDFAGAEKYFEEALDGILAIPDKERDRNIVLDRLIDLYEEWGSESDVGLTKATKWKTARERSGGYTGGLSECQTLGIRSASRGMLANAKEWFRISLTMATQVNNTGDIRVSTAQIAGIEDLERHFERFKGAIKTDYNFPLSPLPRGWSIDVPEEQWKMLDQYRTLDDRSTPYLDPYVDILAPEGWTLSQTPSALLVLDADGNKTDLVLPGPQSLEDDTSEFDDASADLHLLPQDLVESETDAKAVLARIPQHLQEDLEFNPWPNGGGCWTLTPTFADSHPSATHPLTIAGCPVVIPIPISYPVLAGTIPPSDPYPSRLDPTALLPSEVVDDIMSRYPFAQGFYLLFNGMLQILVPEKFDYNDAISQYPNTFGGLPVSYVVSRIVPTHGQETTSDRTLSGRKFKFNSYITFRTKKSEHTLPNISLDITSPIEARYKGLWVVKLHKTFQGRIGLRVRNKHSGEHCLTVATHVLRDAVSPGLFENFPRVVKVAPPSSTWTEVVEIMSCGRHLGTVFDTFDEDAGVFPAGYTSDISLVVASPESTHDIKNVMSPVPNLQWISKEDWRRLRLHPTQLKALGQETRLKSIPYHCQDQYQLVGQGIVLNHPGESGPLAESKWTTVASQCLLYRSAEKMVEPTASSGVALYVESLDGSSERMRAGPAVVGFQSFVERSPNNTLYELEGEPFDTRMRKGYVCFYGAFRLPDRLRDDYEIAC